MSEEVNFLNLGKTQDTKTSTTVKSSTESKKEGISLFDSLLMNNKKNTSSDTSTSKEETTKTPLKTLSTQESKNIKENSSSVEKKEVPTTNSKVLNNEKQEKVEENKIEKNEIKKETSSTIVQNNDKNTKEEKSEIKPATSLLDRMILEAKKKTKSVNNLELKEEKLSSKKENTETSSKQTSLFDELTTKKDDKSKKISNENLLDNKKEIKDKVTEKSEKNEELSSTDTKVKKKDVLEEKVEDTKVKQTQPSLMDQLIDKAKAEQTDKKEVKTSKKENIELINKNSSIKDENSVKNENKINSDKVVKEESLTSIKKENNLENSLKANENKVATSEIKIVEQNIISEKQTQKTQTIDENKNINTSSKVEMQTEIKPEKEVKNSLGNLNNKVEKEELKSELVASKKDELKNINKNEKTVDSQAPNNKTEAVSSLNTTKESGNLSKLEKEALVKEPQKVELNKEQLSDNKVEETKAKEQVKERSLMDQLLRSNQPKTVSNELLDNSNQALNSNSKNNSTDLLTNIYLGSQKNSIYNQIISNKSDAVKTVKEAKSVADVKKGADKLDLNVQSTSVTKETKEQSASELNRQNEIKFTRDSIDRMILDQNAKKESSLSAATAKISSSSNSTSTQEQLEVNLPVSQAATLTIQNRIIGARQQMSSMMSDIARNMYENYRPPITAFRINLFPAQLGQIAILMKNDREGGGLNISMNMSNSSTLDAIVDNQSLLKEAITKNFNNETEVNFEFGMQSDNQNNSSKNSQNEESQSQLQQHSSSDILEAVTENKNVAEDLNYM